MYLKNKKKSIKRFFKTCYVFLLLMILSFPLLVSAKAAKVWCGSDNQGLKGNYAVPAKVPELTAFGILVLEVVAPILLVIFGSIDLIKAITQGKEDEIKKAQGVLIKRTIAAVIVFFIIVVVKLLVRVVGGSGSTGIIGCVDCFVNNNSSCHMVK